jgi:hypothetical protein
MSSYCGLPVLALGWRTIGITSSMNRSIFAKTQCSRLGVLQKTFGLHESPEKTVVYDRLFVLNFSYGALL